LFRSSSGYLYGADINGSLNRVCWIMVKPF
jgi:hypothetical protein